MAGSFQWDNYDVIIRSRPLVPGAAITDVARFYARYTDSDNYIEIMLDTGGRLKVRSKKNGTMSSFLVSEPTGLDPEVTHTYKVKCFESTYRFYIDNVKYAEITNTDHLSGRVGVLTAFCSAQWYYVESGPFQNVSLRSRL